MNAKSTINLIPETLVNSNNCLVQFPIQVLQSHHNFSDGKSAFRRGSDSYREGEVTHARAENCTPINSLPLRSLEPSRLRYPPIYPQISVAAAPLPPRPSALAQALPAVALAKAG